MSLIVVMLTTLAATTTTTSSFFSAPPSSSDTHLVLVSRRHVDGHERQPHDARAVHGEADVLGLVEVLRDLARLEGVPGAEDDEHHVVAEGDHLRQAADAAREHGCPPVRVDFLRGRRLEDQPDDDADQLHRDQTWRRRTGMR